MYFTEDRTILITPFNEEHITDEYVSWFNDPLVCTYNTHCRFPMSKKKGLEYINSINTPESRSIVWAIHCNFSADEYTYDFSNHTHIGNVCLGNIDFISRSAEFSIIIGNSKYWGKGIAAKVLRLVFKHAFLRLNLDRVWLGTSEDNIGMRKSAIKAGMYKTGIVNKSLYVNGAYTDTIVYGISKNKFNKLVGGITQEDGEDEFN